MGELLLPVYFQSTTAFAWRGVRAVAHFSASQIKFFKLFPLRAFSVISGERPDAARAAAHRLRVDCYACLTMGRSPERGSSIGDGHTTS